MFSEPGQRFRDRSVARRHILPPVHAEVYVRNPSQYCRGHVAKARIFDKVIFIQN